MPAGYKITQDEVELICELYKSGKSVNSVAEITGLSYSAVYQALKRNRIEIRKDLNGRAIPPCKEKLICELYQKDEPIDSIERITKVPNRSIYNVLLKNNIGLKNRVKSNGYSSIKNT